MYTLNFWFFKHLTLFFYDWPLLLKIIPIRGFTIIYNYINVLSGVLLKSHLSTLLIITNFKIKITLNSLKLEKKILIVLGCICTYLYIVHNLWKCQVYKPFFPEFKYIIYRNSRFCPNIEMGFINILITNKKNFTHRCFSFFQYS